MIEDATPLKQFPMVIELLVSVESAADKEKAVITSMSEISLRYSELLIEIEKNEKSRYHLVKSFEKLYSVIESDILSVRNLQSYNGMEKFLSSFQALELKLSTAQSVLKLWETIQTTLFSVHRFFESEEVRSQLANELRRFKLIEAGYKSIILNAQKHQKLSTIIEHAPDLPNSLGDMLQGLRGVISDVQGWLDKKRLTFPRLFFLSDEELLDLVSFAKQPSKLKEYLPKYFKHFKTV